MNSFIPRLAIYLSLFLSLGIFLGSSQRIKIDEAAAQQTLNNKSAELAYYHLRSNQDPDDQESVLAAVPTSSPTLSATPASSPLLNNPPAPLKALKATVKPTSTPTPAPAQATFSPTATPAPAQTTPQTTTFPLTADSPTLAALNTEGILKYTNLEREKNGLPALKNNSKLNAAAQIRVDDMLAKQYFAHTSPDGDSYISAVKEVGYAWKSLGENIASGSAGSAGSSRVVDLWMDSPGHRQNILSSSFKEIGIGVATGTYKGKPAWFAVQIFATSP